MYNNDSLKFWLNYYKVDFKNWCNTMLYNYSKKLQEILTQQQLNYNNRQDKNTDNYFRQQQIAGQRNQIKALEIILQEV